MSVSAQHEGVREFLNDQRQHQILGKRSIYLCREDSGSISRRNVSYVTRSYSWSIAAYLNRYRAFDGPSFKMNTIRKDASIWSSQIDLTNDYIPLLSSPRDTQEGHVLRHILLSVRAAWLAPRVSRLSHSCCKMPKRERTTAANPY